MKFLLITVHYHFIFVFFLIQIITFQDKDCDGGQRSAQYVSANCVIFTYYSGDIAKAENSTKNLYMTYNILHLVMCKVYCAMYNVHTAPIA
jgi:hypothetical protein